MMILNPGYIIFREPVQSKYNLSQRALRKMPIQRPQRIYFCGLCIKLYVLGVKLYFF